MTATEHRLLLFAVRSRSHERPDLTIMDIVRDIDLKLQLGLQEGDIWRISAEARPKPRTTKPSELLNQVTKWTDHGYAQDNEGKECSPDDPQAVCWSLAGALDYCNIRSKKPIYDAMQGLFSNLDDLNRTLGYFDVIALLRSVDL